MEVLDHLLEAMVHLLEEVAVPLPFQLVELSWLVLSGWWWSLWWRRSWWRRRCLKGPSFLTAKLQVVQVHLVEKY